MTNLAASDIGVTVLVQRREKGRAINTLKLIFGDGAKTYPAGGIPISKAALGCPNTIDSLTIFDAGTSGYKWSYDAANEKLVAMYVPALAGTAAAHAHDLLVKGGQAASTTNDLAHYATDILGKEAATDATIAGSASATKGGVMSAAAQTVTNVAAPLAQPSTVAIAAQTLRCEVVGW